MMAQRTEQFEGSVSPAANRPNPLLKWVRTYLVERTLWRVPKNDKVLDMCCGYGFYFSINPRAHGVDSDPACIEYLRQRGISARQCDVLKDFPYDDGQFEYVIAHDVLEHFVVEELEILLANVHRVLKSGGVFLVFVPNRKGYDYGVRIGVGHKLYVTAREISNLCRRRFTIRRNYAEPLPRWMGRFFTHNKEVFELVKT
jgi:SAM-dependent methyltransferase